MTRSDLIDAAASAAGSKAKATQIVDDVIGAMTIALRHGEKVEIRGFGSFQVKDSAARTGRNPRTGATMNIAATKRVAFKPSGQLLAR